MTWLWPTDFTLSWILKDTMGKNVNVMKRFITLFQCWRFNWLFDKLYICWVFCPLDAFLFDLFYQQKVICWPSICPNYTLSELTFLCPWWTAWSKAKERESGQLRSSVREISTCLSLLYGDSFHFSPCHLQTLRMKGSEWKFLALKLALH